jgi:purine-binding chemotaxis protein CheW
MTNIDLLNNQFGDNMEENQYLTFVLCGEVFAIEVLNIKEIISYGLITPVPSINKFIKGVINVRGSVLPVVSLAKRFEMQPSSITKKTCIVIVTVTLESDSVDIGLIVDMVNQVFDIPQENIEEIPMFGTSLRKDFIQKIGKVNNKFISILNLQGILNLDEISVTDN